MKDENERFHASSLSGEDAHHPRHVRRAAEGQARAPVEVDGSVFFSSAPPEPPAAPPSSEPDPRPDPPQRGKLMLILQAILSALALVQLWRTQMLPVWYLLLLALLLVLCWLLVLRLLRRSRRSIGPRIFSALLCAVMAVGCVWAQQGLAALDNVTSGLLSGAAAQAITREPFVIYLSGVDTRGELTENARSDVNILAAVNPVTKRVVLVNTPRDYYVDLAGTQSKDKLTHAGLYGVETSMQTLGQLYGIEVGHYIRINFAGFMSVVDALGGVDVYSDQAFTSVGSPGYYDPTTFVEGWNHLDGKAALAFARERHAFASGDIQRGINQMKVIDAMLNKVKSPALLMSFSKLMDAAADCFVTSLSSDQISALVRMQLSDFAAWEIESCTVTGSNSSSTKCYSAPGQKLYVMKPDEASVREAAALLQSVLSGEAGSGESTAVSFPGEQAAHSATGDPNAGVPIPESTPAEEEAPSEPPADSSADEELPAQSGEELSGAESAPPEEEAAPSDEQPGQGEVSASSIPTLDELFGALADAFGSSTAESDTASSEAEPAA